MISVKFECPYCGEINNFYLLYNLSFNLCKKGMGEVPQDSFVAKCEKCKNEVDFEVTLKQYDKATNEN